MYMALAQPGAADAHETCFLLELRNGRTSAVAHPRLQSPDHLVHDHSHRPAIGYATFNAFGHEFRHAVAIAFFENRSRRVARSALEITFTGSCGHCAERSHTSIRFERTPLIQDGLARA